MDAMTYGEARSILVSALEYLDAQAGQLDNPPEWASLVVVWSVGANDDNGDWQFREGLAKTSGPAWLTSSLLLHAARHVAGAIEIADDAEEDY